MHRKGGNHGDHLRITTQQFHLQHMYYSVAMVFHVVIPLVSKYLHALGKLCYPLSCNHGDFVITPQNSPTLALM